MSVEFKSFADLMKVHKEGRDFERVVNRQRGSAVALIAPHGGRIEPFTDIIASAIAAQEFSLYCFNGRLRRAIANLHITSHNFDTGTQWTPI